MQWKGIDIPVNCRGLNMLLSRGPRSLSAAYYRPISSSLHIHMQAQAAAAGNEEVLLPDPCHHLSAHVHPRHAGYIGSWNDVSTGC